MIRACANQKVLIYANCYKLQGLAITGRSPAIIYAADAQKSK